PAASRCSAGEPVAVRFDADTDQLQVTGGLGLTGDTDPLTVCGWFKLASDRDDYSTFFEVRSSDSGDYLIVQTEENGTELVCFPSDTSGWSTSTNLSVGTWYFVALTVDDSGATLWWRTDAAETLSSQAAGQTPGETGLTVLTVGNDTFTEPLDGSACCVRVWNAALDGSELLAESNS